MGIDGYSRNIVYLSCATNNRSQTVYSLFQIAIEEYGVPRLDQIKVERTYGFVDLYTIVGEAVT